jgi:cell division protein ZipA
VDLNLREWLLVLGSVIVIAVVIHGYWRMRSGRNDLKMALDKSFLTPAGEEGASEDISYLKAELPNGGARVTLETVKALLDTDELNLEEDVPVLMEPVGTESVEGTESIESIESIESTDAKISEPEDSAPTRKPQPTARPEKFVVVNVVADGQFDGQTLLESIIELGLVFGDMNIFHRLDKNGRAEFSMANAVEPGTFDLTDMDKLQIVGVVLFMRVHEVNDPIGVYDNMMDVAQKLCDEFGGKLQDESRSAMTSQTIEHCRQGIQDFQYKYSA